MSEERAMRALAGLRWLRQRHRASGAAAPRTEARRPRALDGFLRWSE